MQSAEEETLGEMDRWRKHVAANRILAMKIMLVAAVGGSCWWQLGARVLVGCRGLQLAASKKHAKKGKMTQKCDSEFPRHGPIVSISRALGAPGYGGGRNGISW